MFIVQYRISSFSSVVFFSFKESKPTQMSQRNQFGSMMRTSSRLGQVIQLIGGSIKKYYMHAFYVCLSTSISDRCQNWKDVLNKREDIFTQHFNILLLKQNLYNWLVYDAS